MKSLILAVVQDRDLDGATSALEALGTPVVHLSSVGGFLGMRNTTLLIELLKGQESRIVEALEKSCQKRTEYMAISLDGTAIPVTPMPIPVIVGGATVFVLPIEKFIEI